MFCSAVLLCFPMAPTPPQNCQFPWGISTPSNKWLIGPPQVTTTNSISIGSAVFAVPTNVTTDRHTDTQSDHATVCSKRPLSLDAMWPKNGMGEELRRCILYNTFMYPSRTLTLLTATSLYTTTPPQRWLTDWVKVLCPTWFKICHFGDVPPSQSLGCVLQKLNQTQQKQTCIRNKIYYNVIAGRGPAYSGPQR